MQHDHILKKLILYKPMRPLRQAHFWPQGQNLNKLVRGLLFDATYQISRLDLVVSDNKRDSWGGAKNGRDII